MASASSWYDYIHQGSRYQGIFPWFLLIPAAAFLGLYFISRTRHSLLAAHIITLFYFLAGSYTLYNWGFFIPEGLFIFIFVIIISGILIGRKAAIAYTTAVIAAVYIMAYLQTRSIAPANLYWVKSIGNMNDAFIFSFSFLIIATVACYYNASLLRERDKLEERVEERTRELKKAQDEHLTQLYSFAEFGRLAANLVHDLANPLSTITLNLEQISHKERSELTERAMKGVKQIEDSITNVRSHIHAYKQSQQVKINTAIEEALDIVKNKAQKHKVSIAAAIPSTFFIQVNPIRFRQLLVHLVNNAIEACTDAKAGQRTVRIKARVSGQDAVLEIHDTGHGISSQDLDKVFSSFYTTKDPHEGMGIGLTLCKEYVEQDLHGTISVESSAKHGTTFTVRFPIAL